MKSFCESSALPSATSIARRTPSGYVSYVARKRSLADPAHPPHPAKRLVKASEADRRSAGLVRLCARFHIFRRRRRGPKISRGNCSPCRTRPLRVGSFSKICWANECERVCLRTCEATVGMSIEELIEQVRMHITTCLEQHAPCIFKIGITTGLVHRFYNADYGYIREGYQRMYGLAMLPTPHSRILEQLLILEFGSRQGCRNVAGGGEGKTDGDADLCFTYLVLVGADEYMKWRKRRKR